MNQGKLSHTQKYIEDKECFFLLKRQLQQAITLEIKTCDIKHKVATLKYLKPLQVEKDIQRLQA